MICNNGTVDTDLADATFAELNESGSKSKKEHEITCLRRDNNLLLPLFRLHSNKLDHDYNDIKFDPMYERVTNSFTTIIFVLSLQSLFNVQDDVEETIHLRYDILRILLSIFRVQSLGIRQMSPISSLLSTEIDVEISFTPLFSSKLDTFSESDSSTKLSLGDLCHRLVDVCSACDRISHHILVINWELEKPEECNLQEIQNLIPDLESQISLYFHIIEQILTLLYFHCEHYLSAADASKYDSNTISFFSIFQKKVMNQIIEPFRAWIVGETESESVKSICVLNINQDNITEIFGSRIEPLSRDGNSIREYIDVLILKFQRLEQEYQTQESTSIIQSKSDVENA
ncbi:hypothetical protein RFI_13370 [Reticulomyxa filosa]|uniref:Uncharacterized protein n=1 Tax=Reticulomyxa filosa TaxID=46433 RepID=X6NEP1_RETFI|nr:hypothetical protein RFI_13370 [Reticulomyxa filosa]|eukprot:ETO23807.1 hypothetical protein RFI_13370 [Reticulomyxa filosa]